MAQESSPPSGFVSLPHAVSLWALPALVILGTKAQKLTRLSIEGAGDVVLSFAQDAMVLLLALIALVLLFHVVGRRARSPLSTVLVVAAHAFVPVYVVLAVMEHAFFLTTGAFLEGTYAAMRLHNIGQDLAIIQSELNWMTVAGLIFPVAWSVAVFFWFRAQSKGEATSTTVSPLRKRVLMGLGAASLAVGGLSLVSTSESAQQAQPHFLVGFTQSIFSSNNTGPRASRSKRPLPDGPTTLIGDGNGVAKNALIVVLESTGARATSMYPPAQAKGGVSTTPALERLAARGAVVEHAYTSVPHTTKALVSINCGIYPKMSPGTEEAKFGAIPTECLADLLRGQGFATAYFQSAEENYERRADLVKEFGYETFKGKESLDGTGYDEASYFGWEDDVLVGPTLAWIDAQRTANKRFFGTLLTLTAHHPYALPQGYTRQDLADGRAKNDYLNAVRYVDGTLEKLVKGLDERGILEDTLLIVLGDHGEGFGEHRRFQHDAVIYEEGIQIPMVLAGAGITAAKRIGGLRQNIDVAPTIVEALGYRSTGGSFDGKSLLSTSGHEEVFVSCHYQNYCMASIRAPAGTTTQMKSIHHYKKGAPELFDLVKDPLEKTNLLGSDASKRAAVDGDVVRMLDTKSRNNRRYSQRTKSRVERYVTKSRPDTASVPHFKPMNIRIDAHTRLIGAAVTPEVEAGDQIEVVQFYAVDKRPKGQWKTFLSISGPQRMRGDHTPVEGAYPVRRWKAGDFIEDRFVLSTRPDTLPGRYFMFTGMKRVKGKPGIARDGDKVVAKDGRIRLPDFRITKPKVETKDFIFAAAPALLDDTVRIRQVDATFGNVARVVGLGIDKKTIKGGLKTTLTYVFEVLAPIEKGSAFFVDFDGPSKVKRLAHVPVSGTHPPENWTVGTFVVDRHEIITHTRHRNGTYRVLLGLKQKGGDVAATSDKEDVDEGRLHVGTYTLAD